ncbi:YpfB family protein [Bacillus cihuensis]|uniref:YpfB family protein n=1 Tax=Bacillus cihuensis TaxID=1208599 RepID=UPI001F432119|nr:YpfB family protein [Bacillus cihuensis]
MNFKSFLHTVNKYKVANGGFLVILKTVERIIIKLIWIQLIFLLVFQLFLNREESFGQLKKLAQYEGVNSNNYTKVIETFEDLQD